MGTAAAALGAYQGTSAFVLRTWGQANADTLVRYLQAYIEGVHWTLNIANKPEAVALMIERLKLSDDIAAQAYDVATNPKRALIGMQRSIWRASKMCSACAHIRGRHTSRAGQVHRAFLLPEGDGRAMSHRIEGADAFNGPISCLRAVPGSNLNEHAG
jgi:hypothetical protein